MAPPVASSEGVSTQSDFGDTDDTSSLLAPAIDIDKLESSRGMSCLSARSILEPRREGLRAGGIAAVVIGVALFFVLAIICAFPFVVRRIRRSKIRRNGNNRLDTAETAFIPPPHRPSGQAPATGPSAPSRMSSKDTLGHKVSAGRERQSTKEMTISSHNGIDNFNSNDLGSHQRGYTADESTHPPNSTTGRGTDHSFGRSPTWKSETSYPWTPAGLELVATRADGMDYSEATHGHSAAYYSPIIPSEAFGMVTPPPTDEPVTRAPPPRRSSSLASSLKQNLVSLLGGRSSTKDSMNTRSKAVYQPQPTSDVLREGLSDSPTELTSSSFPPPSTRQLGSPMHFKPPSPPSEPDHAGDLEAKKEKLASPPILPPTIPAPGTVNPMDIMAPSNPTEHNWHTNQQLYNIANPPPKPPVEPEPSQAPTPQSPEQPFEHHQQYLRQQQRQQKQQETQHQQWSQAALSNGALNSNRTGHAQMNGWATQTDQTVLNPDVHMNEVSQPVAPNQLMPNHANHHYYETEITDLSEHSPQPGGHASSGASFQTTPNTQIDSSPSPRSDGSSDIRNSTSPYPGLQQSPRSFMCDECGRFFDQVHKLNHHKRYHERPHECTHPGCGKRFGTKTHLDRHINDKHKKTKKFHCTVTTCPYSKAGGKSFPRKDNWRRHMVNIHQVTPMGEPEPDITDEPMGGT